MERLVERCGSTDLLAIPSVAQQTLLHFLETQFPTEVKPTASQRDPLNEENNEDEPAAAASG